MWKVEKRMIKDALLFSHWPEEMIFNVLSYFLLVFLLWIFMWLRDYCGFFILHFNVSIFYVIKNLFDYN